MGLVQTDYLLQGKEAEGTDEPPPEVWGVKHSQKPENQVQEVSPVENLAKKFNSRRRIYEVLVVNG